MYSQKQQKEFIDLTTELLNKLKIDHLPKKEELNIVRFDAKSLSAQVKERLIFPKLPAILTARNW